MRTTITLDPDVEQLLKNEMRERDISFKEAVNDALRRGLKGPVALKQRHFEQRTFRMGSIQRGSIVKALQLAGELEDEEVLRKMALDK